MSESQRRVCLVGFFLLFFLPGGSLALVLGFVAISLFPDLATVILIGAGLAAFVAAVSAAMVASLACPGQARTEPVLRLLDLRRNRARYAFILAIAGAAPAYLALRLAFAIGGDAPVHPGPWAFGGMVAGLFAVARVLIGEFAGTPQALHRVLRDMKPTG